MKLRPKEVDAAVSGTLYGKKIVAIAAGKTHNLALDSAGKVYSWGENSKGELGDGSTVNRFAPVAVAASAAASDLLSDKTVIDISCGQYSSYALTSDGTVYSWGGNEYLQLGNGNHVIEHAHQPQACRCEQLWSAVREKGLRHFWRWYCIA